MDRREDELDRPLGRHPLGLQRIGEAEAADRQVGAGGAGAVELAVDVLPFRDHRAFRDQREVRFHQVAVQEGRADLDRDHAAFGGEEAGERDFQLAVREEEDAAAVQRLSHPGDGGGGAGAGGGCYRLEPLVRHAEGVGDGAEPGGRPVHAEGEGRGDPGGAPAGERGMGVAEEGLGQGVDRVRPDRQRIVGAAGGQEAHRADAEAVEQRARLVLDHVGQRADDEQLARVRPGQARHHGGEAGVLALRERRLDPAARVGQDRDVGRVDLRQPLGRARDVELDDLGRAGPDEEQAAHVRAPVEQFGHHAVEFVVGVLQAGQVALFQDGGGEARLGEDHHAGGRLEQVRAGAGADHQEEGVLHHAVQPDDAGQAAEHLALAAFAEDGSVGAAGHAGAPSSRASRSFRRNWPAFTA